MDVQRKLQRDLLAQRKRSLGSEQRVGSNACHVNGLKNAPTQLRRHRNSRHQGLGAVFQRQKLQGKLNDAIKGEKLLLLLRFLRQKKQKGNCFFALFPAL